MARRRLGPVVSCASLVIAAMSLTVAADPPTAEECLCREGKHPGAPTGSDCERSFVFPPVGGYTGPSSEILGPGDVPGRPFASVCFPSYRIISATAKLTGDDEPSPDEPIICGSCHPLLSLWGFAPPINLRFGVAQGDYAPVSQDPVEGALPLATSTTLGRGHSIPFERPCLGDSVDLITGQPLIREVDFELPFGSTTFRHIRTYSQIPHAQVETQSALDGVTRYQVLESGAWWDAAGHGWMLSHNPLLLIDAVYAGWERGLPFESDSPQSAIERCIFVPDAHRSIPFRSLKNGHYEAPSRFDAAIHAKGGLFESNPAVSGGHSWEEFPTEWNIWLQKRSLKYTIKPVYDDVPQADDGDLSLHEYPTPESPCGHNVRFFGMPHYGVATAIEDDRGNRIEIDYNPFTQHQYSPLQTGGGCFSCGQACTSKGTISQVRLVSATDSDGLGRVDYTLVYVYRDGNTLTLGEMSGYEDVSQPMIHEVYVVPGSVAVPNATRRITREQINAVMDQWEVETSDPVDMLARISAIEWHEDEEWMDRWTIRVKYLYTDDSEFLAQRVSRDGYDSEPLTTGAELRLIQSSVTRRENIALDGSLIDPEDRVETTEHTVYRYRWNYFGAMGEQGQLRAIYHHSTLESMREHAVAVLTSGDEEYPSTAEKIHETWPLAVHLLRDTDTYEGRDTLARADQLFNYWEEMDAGRLVSNRSFERWGTVDRGPGTHGFHDSAFHREIVDDYLRGVPNNPEGESNENQRAEQPAYAWDGVTVHVDRSGTQERYYRLYRFLMMSTDLSENKRPFCPLLDETHHTLEMCLAQHARYPMYGWHPHFHRGMLHEPYLQRMFPGLAGGSQPIFRETNPAHPLWIAVIDEHESYETLLRTAVDPDGVEWRSIQALRQAGANGSSGDAALVPLSRRVVMMNAAGFVLSDHMYDTRAGTLDAASGMWEEFVYDWHDPSRFSGGDLKPVGRLLEHRTYGWSVAKADAINDPDDNNDDDSAIRSGLVYVYEYDTASDSSKIRQSLLPGAVGVKWGTVGEPSAAHEGPMWLKQYIRDPLRPDLVLHEIDFLQAPTGLLPFQPLEPSELVALSTGGSARIKTHAYQEDIWRKDTAPAEDEHPPVIAELTLEPPAKETPDGELLFPVTIKHIDMHWSPDYIWQRGGLRDTWTGRGAVSASAVASGKAYSVVTGDLASERLVPTFDPTSDVDVPYLFASVSRANANGVEVFNAVDVDLSIDMDGMLTSLPDEVYARFGETNVTSHSTEWSGLMRQGGFRVPAINGKAWVRRNAASDEPALQHWGYVGLGEWWPIFTLDHTGREMRVFYRTERLADGVTVSEKTTCEGLFWIGEGANRRQHAFAPGKIEREMHGMPADVLSVRWNPSESNFQNTYGYDDILSVVEWGMDAVGRPSGFTVKDAVTDESLEQKVEYGRFGEIAREKHHDGTIIRNIHDERGRLIAVYKGSTDLHDYWGNVDPDEPETWADDLILVERRSYGTGVRDANLPVSTRTYRTRPLEQYGDDPADLDDEGVLTATIYDWRGRALVTRQFAEGGSTAAIARQEVVFRDHQDNILISATFGGELPWDDDDIPTLFPDSDPVPSVSALLASSGLIALEARTYNPRGQAESIRTYNMTAKSVNSYHETLTYYDFAGRPMYTKSAGDLITRNVQDAKGRQTLTSTYYHDGTSEIELSRTETAYDDQDNPFRVKTYERRHDATGATLSDSNAIVTYRYSWYDHAGRVRATADFGAASPDGFVNGVMNDERENDPDGFAWNPVEDVGWIDVLDFSPQPVVRENEVVPGWFPENVPVRISSFRHDEPGNQTVAVSPDGVITRSLYNGFGQATLVWENAPRNRTHATLPIPDSRVTLNEYAAGQLSHTGVLLEIPDSVISWVFPLSASGSGQSTGGSGFDAGSVVDWSAGVVKVEPGPSPELPMLASRVIHGAKVHMEAPNPVDGTDPAANATSFAGSFVAALDYPTVAGLPDPGPGISHDVSYTYYIDGLLATRTDERGIIFKYYYDGAGRLTQILVDESNASTYLYNTTPPKDRVDRVDFEYDAATGTLTTVTAYDRDGGPSGAPTIIASNSFQYDERGNLIAESQYHAGAILPTFDPTIWYAWDYAAAGAGNFDRLASMTYPIPVPVPGGSPGATQTRELDFLYGPGNSPTNAQSLVTTLEDSFLGQIAAFDYTGTGRRVAFHRGDSSGGVGTAVPIVRSSVFDNPIAAFGGGTLPDSTGYYGLTQFGEHRALAYWRDTLGSTPEVLAAERYAYDAAGRRMAVWRQHVPIAAPNGPPAGTNQRSQLFGYDALGRLTSAAMGEISGELVGGSNHSLAESDLLPVPRTVEWEIDVRDVWTSRTLTHDGNGNGSGSDPEDSETTAHFVGDRNELVGYEDPAGLPSGSPTPALSNRFHNDASGNLILDQARFYEYDAWGRLVKVSERGTLAIEPPLVGSDEYTLSGEPGHWLVHYTYDGLGRLIRKQTPIRAATGPNAGEQIAIRSERYFYDGARRIQEVVTDQILLLEPTGHQGLMVTIGNELSGMLEADSDQVEINLANVYVDREYIYVPSAAAGYVDEFIAQVDRLGRAWWILQDANFNVLGMTDDAGDVVRQHTYDPYGELLAAEDLATHPGLKIGHQGLFFDRLEQPTTTSAPNQISLGASVQLEPGVWGLYHAGNRILLPRYGRWAQRDPNASGQVLRGLWHSGASCAPSSVVGPLSELTGDGWNVFAFAGSSPFNGTDPNGLLTIGSVFNSATLRVSLLSGGIGGVVSGTANAALGNGSFAQGFAAGFVAGAAGGAAGGAIVGASGGVLSGLVAAGAVDGGLAAFLETYLLTGDLEQAGRASVLGAGLGAFTMGAGGAVASKFVTQVDNIGSVWARAPWQRGLDIETCLGANCPPSYKTIDRWSNGVATSIKSVDLTCKTYQTPSALRSMLKKYVNLIRNYQGSSDPRLRIHASQIRGRELLLAIPPNATQAQISVLNEIARYARSQGVIFSVRVIP